LLDVVGYDRHARFNDRAACNQNNPEVRIIPFVRDGSGGFPKEPFGAVSFYRVPNLPAGHHSYAQAIAIGIIMIKDNRVTAYDLSAAAITNAELPTLLERHQGLPPLRRPGAWKRTRRPETGLHREALAALLAATLQDEPAGLGLHPCAEAVNTGPLQETWLECAFHNV